jgi:hypothetical protein
MMGENKQVSSAIDRTEGIEIFTVSANPRNGRLMSSSGRLAAREPAADENVGSARRS